MKRPLLWTVLTLVLSGFLAYGSSRVTWVTCQAQDGLGTPRAIELSGLQCAPLTIALALLAFAAVPAVIAVHGVTLRAIGIAVALTGLCSVGQGIHWWLHPPPAPQLVRLASLSDRYQLVDLSFPLTGSILIMIAGLGACVGCFFSFRVHRTHHGLGSRFDSPGVKKTRSTQDRSAWSSLDAGEDPTL